MKSLPLKYLLPVIILLVIINGCSPNRIALKGNYETIPLAVNSNKSIDTCWLKVMQLFAEKGLGIDKLDRKKGLLVSKKTPLMTAYTFEDKNGQLNNADAWVVLGKVTVHEKERMPKTIYGQWSIEITETGTGTTTIKIDPVVICTYYTNSFTKFEVRGQSTGKLEALIKGA